MPAIAGTLLPPIDSPDPDLLDVAHVCTELARVQTTADVPPVLRHMAMALDAIGLVLWMWDPIANELRPTLAHGYSDRVVAQLPRVERDSNNATAAAFRAGETCIVSGRRRRQRGARRSVAGAGRMRWRARDRAGRTARGKRIGASALDDLRGTARDIDRYDAARRSIQPTVRLIAHAT